MGKYFVSINLIEKYTLDIEANSEEEAIEKANELLEADGKEKYHDDSDAEESAYEI